MKNIPGRASCLCKGRKAGRNLAGLTDGDTKQVGSQRSRSDHTKPCRWDRELDFSLSTMRRHWVVSNQVVMYSCQLLQGTGLQLSKR